MALVSMTKMINDAFENKYAVGQFNINNLEWTQAVLDAAQEANSPVILGVSEGAAKYMGGFNVVGAFVKALVEERKMTQPVALHLDHGTSYESCKSAIDAGFTSVMIDGSHHSIEKNIEMTQQVVKYAHENNVSVEAEVGTVGGDEDGIIGGIQYADINDCEKLVNEANIDALAAALGSVHGPYDGEPVLGFDEMKAISELTKCPLVLHGGSGIPEEQVKKAINLGHAKINVNTECQQTWTAAVQKFVAESPKQYDPRKIIGPGKVAITKTVVAKMIEFGSANKA